MPLDRVGCYVPGGRYPLPSSLLMTAIPARVAGVARDHRRLPAAGADGHGAALEAGVSRLFRVGGAHAIAALAYGTATIPRVDKIVGPGNRYVAAAKALVARDCAIDFYAGPTEIVIVVGRRPAGVDRRGPDRAGRARPRRARDPPHAVAPTRRRGRARDRCEQMPADGPARAGARRERRHRRDAHARRGDRARQRMAPEHLVVRQRRVAARADRAGAVFVGDYSAQAAGDYATGSNHVLPTPARPVRAAA